MTKVKELFEVIDAKLFYPDITIKEDNYGTENTRAL